MKIAKMYKNEIWGEKKSWLYSVKGIFIFINIIIIKITVTVILRDETNELSNKVRLDNYEKGVEKVKKWSSLSLLNLLKV